MNTPKIPKGWRRLKPGEIIKAGDKWWRYADKWKVTCDVGGEQRELFYIRRLPAKRPSKPAPADSLKQIHRDMAKLTARIAKLLK